MCSGIYKIWFVGSNKIYIGQSKDLKRRKGEHIRELKNGVHFNSYLQNAFNKYGIKKIHFEVIHYENNYSNLDMLEQRYIDKYGFDNLYNLMEDVTANLGRKFCTIKVYKVCQKTFKILGEYNSVTDAALDNNVFQPAITIAIRDKHRCKGFYWVKNIEDIDLLKLALNNKIKKSLSPKKRNSNLLVYLKKVKQINPYTLEVIKIWNNIDEISKCLNLDYRYILKHCNGQKKITGGYLWQWEDDKEKLNTPFTKVKQINKDTGELIKIWNSAYYASVYFGHVNSSNINRVLKGIRKSAFGYFWERIDNI